MKKIAVITGASKGIGQACAVVFLAEGWQVINLSRSPCPVSGVFNLTADFAMPHTLQTQQAVLQQHLSGSTQVVLIHNAAFFAKDSVQDINAETLNHSLAINVVAPLLLNQMLLPHMPAGSSIIYLGSTLSEKAVSNTASYTIAKHAVVGMMRATCQDLADTPVHTCCICPGFTDTEMLRHHVQHNEDLLHSLAQRVGAKRLIEPDEIAQTVYFAATHPVINGSVIHANLGQIEA